MNTFFWIRAGATLMFLDVAFGAFAAHALQGRLTPDMRAIFETGVRYQAYHGLALFIIAWFSAAMPSRNVDMAGWCFLCGTTIFSGSLYFLAISGIRWLGAITPIGGLLFLAGWLLLLFQPGNRILFSK